MSPEWALTINNWLPEQISNGSHGHWSTRQKKLEHAAALVWVEARAAGLKAVPGKVHVHVHFVFPEKRRRDVDNLTARCKGVLDGLKRGFIDDDSMDVMTLEVSAEVERGRKALVVTLEARA